MEAELNKVKMDIAEIKGDMKVLKAEFAASKECVAEIKLDIKELGDKIQEQIYQISNRSVKDILDMKSEFDKRQKELAEDVDAKIEKKADGWVEWFVKYVIGGFVVAVIGLFVWLIKGNAN